MPDDVPGRSSADGTTRGCLPVRVDEEASPLMKVRFSVLCEEGPAVVGGASAVVVAFGPRRRLRRRSGRC